MSNTLTIILVSAIWLILTVITTWLLALYWSRDFKVTNGFLVNSFLCSLILLPFMFISALFLNIGCWISDLTDYLADKTEDWKITKWLNKEI